MINEQEMEKVTQALVALTKEYGDDGDGAKRIMIPRSRDQAMAFIKKHSWPLKASFPIDNSEVIGKAKSLAAIYRNVWVVPNTKTLEYEIYVCVN